MVLFLVRALLISNPTADQCVEDFYRNNYTTCILHILRYLNGSLLHGVLFPDITCTVTNPGSDVYPEFFWQVHVVNILYVGLYMRSIVN